MLLLCNLCFLRICWKSQGNRTLCCCEEGFWWKTDTAAEAAEEEEEKKQKMSNDGEVLVAHSTHSTEMERKNCYWVGHSGCVQDAQSCCWLLLNVEGNKSRLSQLSKAALRRSSRRNCAKIPCFFKAHLHFAAAVKLFFIFPVSRTGYNTQEVWALQRRLLTPSHSHLWFPAGSRRGHCGGGGRGMSCSIQPWRGGGGGGVLGGAIKPIFIFIDFTWCKGAISFANKDKIILGFSSGDFLSPAGIPPPLPSKTSESQSLSGRSFLCLIERTKKEKKKRLSKQQPGGNFLQCRESFSWKRLIPFPQPATRGECCWKPTDEITSSCAGNPVSC